MWENIKAAPADAILGLTEAFIKDTNPNKVNLGVGVYKDDTGRTPILESVKAAEKILIGKETTKSYLPIIGNPLFAAGGVGKNGNITQNGLALIMLGASGVHIGKYIMQAAAGCLGSERNRCNVCNIGLCPKGITSQNPKLYRRLDPDQVAERVAETFMSIRTEMKKILAPLGRSQSLPIGMSDAIGIEDKDVADKLKIQYVC